MNKKLIKIFSFLCTLPLVTLVSCAKVEVEKLPTLQSQVDKFQKSEQTNNQNIFATEVVNEINNSSTIEQKLIIINKYIVLSSLDEGFHFKEIDANLLLDENTSLEIKLLIGNDREEARIIIKIIGFKDKVQLKILTKEIVNANFAIGGIWEGLDTINYQDLASYNEIGEMAFYDNKNLFEIYIPKHITKIGKKAFAASNMVLGSILKFVNIEPNSKLTIIDDMTFQFATRLSAITIPKSVISINQRAFEGCNSLVTIFESNSNLETIGNFAFANNHAMQEFILPNKLKSIGERAFRSCNGVINMYVPQSVTIIENLAFELLFFLETITLPRKFKNPIPQFGIYDDIWAKVVWI